MFIGRDDGQKRIRVNKGIKDVWKLWYAGAGIIIGAET